MDTVLLGNRIRELRELRGLTQEDLAAATGVGCKHISVLERGVKEPKLATFLAIADALKVTPNDLLLTNDLSDDYESAIAHKVSQLPAEKQEKLYRILTTLVDEL